LRCLRTFCSSFRLASPNTAALASSAPNDHRHPSDGREGVDPQNTVDGGNLPMLSSTARSSEKSRRDVANMLADAWFGASGGAVGRSFPDAILALSLGPHLECETPCLKRLRVTGVGVQLSARSTKLAHYESRVIRPGKDAPNIGFHAIEFTVVWAKRVRANEITGTFEAIASGWRCFGQVGGPCTIHRGNAGVLVVVQGTAAQSWYAQGSSVTRTGKTRFTVEVTLRPTPRFPHDGWQPRE
jgi:hypothetical protein